MSNISRKFRLSNHVVIPAVSIFCLMAAAYASELQVRWIDIDDKGNFSVAFFEKGKRVDRKVSDRFQFFVSANNSPRDSRDLRSVDDIDELEQTWTTFKGVYRPAAYAQEYPLISGSPYDAAVAHDSCFFMVCPRPAVLRGYDNEIRKTCTPPALFRWHNYERTIENITGNFFRRAKVYLKDMKSGAGIFKIKLELGDLEADGIGSFDSIRGYIESIVRPEAIDENRLRVMLKETHKKESNFLILEDGSLESFKLFFPPDSMGLPCRTSFSIVSNSDPAYPINETIAIDPNIPRQQFSLSGGQIEAEILVTR